VISPERFLDGKVMERRVSHWGCVVVVVGPILGCLMPAATPSCGAGSTRWLVSAVRQRAPVGQSPRPIPAGVFQGGGISGDGSLWPNEPAGLTVVSDGPFTVLNGNGWGGQRRQTTNGSGLSLTRDSTAPLSPSTVLTFTYAVGYQGGSEPGVEFYHLPTPTPETYFGFWWKPSNPWQSHPSGVNKIAFLFPFTSGAGSMYIMMFFDGTTYTTEVVTSFPGETRRLAPNATATPIGLGAWHRIEWYARYSATPTSRDGVTRWWLDGVLQGAYTDLQLPADAGFAEYTIAPTWGGVGYTKTETDCYWYHHAHVSRR
jgi:hypothetical protein